VTVLRTSDSRLVLVDLQTQAPFDELSQAGHHSLTRSFAAHVDVSVVGVADELVTTPVKLPIELVQHDV
jgi:hypothetical protein